MKFENMDLKTRILSNKPYENEVELIFSNTTQLIREWVYRYIPKYITKANLSAMFTLRDIRKFVLDEYMKELEERVTLVYNVLSYDEFLVGVIEAEFSSIEEIELEYFSPMTVFEPYIIVKIDEKFWTQFDRKEIIVTPFDECIYKITSENEYYYSTVNEKGEAKVFAKDDAKLHYYEVLRSREDIVKLKHSFTSSQSFLISYKKPAPGYVLKWIVSFEKLIMEMPEQFRTNVSLGTELMTYTYYYKNPYMGREIQF